MALAVAEQQSVASNTVALVFTLGVASAVGDLLVLIQGNNFYSVNNLQTPTGTAASAWTLRDTFDGGTNLTHFKLWTAPVTTAGAQTVNANSSTLDEERGAALWRIPRGMFDTSNKANGTTSLSHVAPSLTPKTTDEIYICAWTSNDAGAGSYNYTYPTSPFVGLTERVLTGFLAFGWGYEPITSGVATGTRTATASFTHPWAAIATLINPIGAVSPYPRLSDRAVKRLRFR